MATIQRRGPKQYRVLIRKKGYPPQTRTFVTAADARAWASLIESEMARGAWLSRSDAERTTLAEALERYRIEELPAKKSAVRQGYKIDVILRHRVAKLAMAHIRGADIAAYRDDRVRAGLSPGTVNNELSLISHCFSVAIKEWRMESLRNPVSMMRRLPSPKGRDRRLAGDEEARLLKACRGQLRPIVMLAIETAMRRNEILGLRWADISADIALVRDTKTGNDRQVPLSTRARAVLADLARRIDGRVFTLRPVSVTVAFMRATKRAGIDGLRFHDLRHEAASRLFERGLQAMEVAAITGHSDLRVLKRYTHLRAEDLARKLG